MNMTHYMELLATNQPWNLLIFMAVPVILAETVAITELYLLYSRNYGGIARNINRLAAIAAGLYFTGVFVYLMLNAVLPISAANEWRGPVDMIAVGFYLLGVVPLAGLALLDLNLLARTMETHRKMGFHAALVGVFLIVAHVAMIAGMMDPALGSNEGDNIDPMRDMTSAEHMEMMSH